jgi:tetratricopeptide (TPR) repeat protein
MKKNICLYFILIILTVSGCQKLEPESGSYHYIKGDQQFKEGNYERAIKEYTKAVRFDKNNDHLYNTLALSYAMLGDYEKVYENSRAYLLARKETQKLSDKEFQAQLDQQVINTLIDAKRIEPTRAQEIDIKLNKLYQSVEISEEKLSPAELIAKGDEYYNSFNYERAIRYYEKAIEEDPDNPKALFNLGMMHVSENNNKKGVTYLERAAVITPDSPEIYEWLGLAYKKLGNKKLSEANYKKAEEKSPASGL